MRNFVSKIKGFIRRRKIKKEGGEAFSETLRSHIYKEKKIKVGYGTYGGCFNPSNNLPKEVEFGNYCSIAVNIRIFRANHPKSYFTSHPLFYNVVMGYVKTDQLKRPKLTIGHDVWIGEWVVLLPSVRKVGNGAIVGAGSVVTKDIAPYTIVAGNPARVIGKRFSDDTIAKLEDTKWWNWDKDTLIKNKSKLEQIVSEG